MNSIKNTNIGEEFQLGILFNSFQMYRRIILIALSFLLLSCSKDDDLNIQNINGNEILSVGHSGMGVFSLYPRNSYESLSKALNIGADGLEIDIQLTKDNQLIAFHDDSLSQSTTINGHVRSLNWSEISGSIYSNPIYSEYAVISLRQFFSHINNLKSHQYILEKRPS